MIQYFSKGAEAIFYVTMCSLLLQVYNSSSLRADSLMGEFKVRLKSEVKKWITLKVCNNNVFFNVFNVSGWCWLHLRRTLYVSEIPHCSLIHVLLAHVHFNKTMILCVFFTVDYSSLCHEEMAAFKRPRWLKLWRKGLPESQHVHRWDRGWASGTYFV